MLKMGLAYLSSDVTKPWWLALLCSRRIFCLLHKRKLVDASALDQGHRGQAKALSLVATVGVPVFPSPAAQIHFLLNWKRGQIMMVLSPSFALKGDQLAISSSSFE